MRWLRQLFFHPHRYADHSASILEHPDEKTADLFEDGRRREGDLICSADMTR